MDRLQQFLGQESLSYQAGTGNLLFEFRTSQPNGVSEEEIKNIGEYFSSLTYPYTLKSYPDIVITNFWGCIKQTKYIYWQAIFSLQWDGSKGNLKSYPEPAMKQEFSQLSKAYVIWHDTLQDCQCPPNQGRTLTNCGGGIPLTGGGSTPPPSTTSPQSSGFPMIPVAIGISALGILAIIYFLARKK